jgi:hypothetical protein
MISGALPCHWFIPKWACASGVVHEGQISDGSFTVVELVAFLFVGSAFDYCLRFFLMLRA